jgi:hypothetical protein
MADARDAAPRAPLHARAGVALPLSGAVAGGGAEVEHLRAGLMAEPGHAPYVAPTRAEVARPKDVVPDVDTFELTMPDDTDRPKTVVRTCVACRKQYQGARQQEPDLPNAKPYAGTSGVGRRSAARPASPDFSKGGGASGSQVSKTCFTRTSWTHAEESRDADRV